MDRRELFQALMSGAGLGAIGSLRNPAEGASLPRAGTNAGGVPFVQVRDGTRLFYQDWGSGRPLLFVAPWALNSSWWEYQMAHLAAQGFRCIAYDRRGHGRSDQPGRGYEFDTLADDLHTLIERLDLRDVTLVGHSMGCAEVVRYLSRHGASRASRAALVATITPFIMKADTNPDGIPKSTLEKGRATLSKDRAHQIGIAAPAFFGAPANAVSQEVMDWWVRMMVDQCSLNTMLELHRAFTETDFRPDLRRITLPTLLIHGDSDSSARIDLTARKTLPLIPGSRLAVYEGAAHGLPITHMDRLNADIAAFARGQA